MTQTPLRIIPTSALRYTPHTRCHEVIPTFDAKRDAVFLTWDADGYGVEIRDARGSIVAGGVLAVRTFTDVLGVSTGQRAQMDRLEVDGVTIGYCLESELTVGEQYQVTQSAVVSALPSLPQSGFGPGTMIRTKSGEDPVEWLETGVLVDTKDNGPQPLRGVLRCPIPQNRAHEMMTIRPGELDAQSPVSALSVPQNQPVLLTSPMAELYFGAAEVLASARHVIAGGTNTTLCADSVVTVLIFDDPQLVCAEGLWASAYFGDTASLARLATYLSARDLLSLRHCVVHGQTPRFTLKREEAALVRPVPNARIAAGKKFA